MANICFDEEVDNFTLLTIIPDLFGVPPYLTKVHQNIKLNESYQIIYINEIIRSYIISYCITSHIVCHIITYSISHHSMSHHNITSQRHITFARMCTYWGHSITE